MNFHYDIVDPQEIDLMFSKKEVDIDGFHLVIDCTGNTLAVKKVCCHVMSYTKTVIIIFYLNSLITKVATTTESDGGAFR